MALVDHRSFRKRKKVVFPCVSCFIPGFNRVCSLCLSVHCVCLTDCLPARSAMSVSLQVSRVAERRSTWLGNKSKTINKSMFLLSLLLHLLVPFFLISFFPLYLNTTLPPPAASVSLATRSVLHAYFLLFLLLFIFLLLRHTPSSLYKRHSSLVSLSLPSQSSPDAEGDTSLCSPSLSQRFLFLPRLFKPLPGSLRRRRSPSARPRREGKEDARCFLLLWDDRADSLQPFCGFRKFF